VQARAELGLVEFGAEHPRPRWMLALLLLLLLADFVLTANTSQAQARPFGAPP
jgi:hypothetical protein